MSTSWSKTELRRRLQTVLGEHPVLEVAVGAARGYDIVALDYKLARQQRYVPGSSPNQRLHAVIDAGRSRYLRLLDELAGLAPYLERIPLREKRNTEPAWDNPYFGPVDAACLYGMLATSNPKNYFEIGSGYSTRFARRSVRDHNLQTQLIAVDPNPRVSVRAVCDELIQTSLTELDISSLVSRISPGDFVFFDGSHRAQTNSDVVTFFLELLPALPKGTVVHVHDIFLPYDYPAKWARRLYSEQFLLGVFLLSAKSPCITLPNAFVCADDELSSALQPLVPRLDGALCVGEGCSFWFQVTEPPVDL